MLRFGEGWVKGLLVFGLWDGLCFVEFVKRHTGSGLTSKFSVFSASSVVNQLSFPTSFMPQIEQLSPALVLVSHGCLVVLAIEEEPQCKACVNHAAYPWPEVLNGGNSKLKATLKFFQMQCLFSWRGRRRSPLPALLR